MRASVLLWHNARDERSVRTHCFLGFNTAVFTVCGQFVHKGDLLLVIDPTNFKIALQLADAAVDQAQATAQNAQREAERRRKLDDLSVSVEQKQDFNANAVARPRRNISRKSQTAIRPKLTWSAPRSAPQ